MHVTAYSGKDIEKCYEIWKDAHYDGITDISRFLICTVADVNFRNEDFILAYDGENPAGFVYAPRRFYSVKRSGEIEKTGYVTLLSVAKGYSVSEIGSLLLEAAEEHHKKQGMNCISTGYSPVYINQGYTSEEKDYTGLFENYGYSSYESARRVLDLENAVISADESTKKELGKKGIYTGPLKPDLVASFLDEDNPVIGSGWSKEFRMRLEHGMDFDSVRVAAVGPEVIGACVFGDPFSNSGRFGPFGVNEKYRLMGIGKVLLGEIIEEMKKRNIRSAWMQWTPLNGPASHIYDKTGFKVTDIFKTFTKEI